MTAQGTQGSTHTRNRAKVCWNQMVTKCHKLVQVYHLQHYSHCKQTNPVHKAAVCGSNKISTRLPDFPASNAIARMANVLGTGLVFFEVVDSTISVVLLYYYTDVIMYIPSVHPSQPLTTWSESLAKFRQPKLWQVIHLLVFFVRSI